jgi:uncharacterized protein (TIGR03435 family)
MAGRCTSLDRLVDLSRSDQWPRNAPSILVNGLLAAVGAIIVDKTGLTGRFDVVLHWNPVDRQAPDSTEPSLFTALGEQLGLRLKPTKTTVNTIVIDRLEMPSPN